MAKVKDCPGFETFGADVKEARKAKNLARKDLAEKVNIDTRYLANIENEGTIPSLPVIIQLVKICGLPMERYFNPEVMREESELRQRVGQKLKLCPEQYLPIVEGAIDGDSQAVDQVLRYYEGYINKLCTRTLYDPDGQPHVRVDEYMKRRLEIKLIHSIVSMS